MKKIANMRFFVSISLSFCIFIFITFITSAASANDIFQYVDENGRVIFMNTIPSSSSHVTARLDPAQKSQPQKSNIPQVNLYYDLVKSLQIFSDVLKKQELPEKADLLNSIALELKLIKSQEPGWIIRPSVLAKSITFENVAKKIQFDLENQEVENANLLKLRAFICLRFASLVLTESYFDDKSIPYHRIEVDEGLCLSDNATKKKPKTTEKLSNTSATKSIRTYCLAEWKNDYRMIEHCIESQTKSFNNIKSIRGQIADDCRAEWNDDYKMIEHCIDKQSGAKRRLGM